MGHVARIEGKNVHTGFWWGIWMERDRLVDPGLVGRITLILIFR